MNLLIIENEPKVLKGISALVNKVAPHCNVKALDNAEAALAFLEVYQPDIVFTDIRMGGMDGLSFIKIAKELNETVVFVVISGYDNFEYAKEAITLGVVDYVLKPISLDSISKAYNNAEQKVIERHERKTYNQELMEYYMEKLVNDKVDSSIILNKMSGVVKDCNYCICSITSSIYV